MRKDPLAFLSAELDALKQQGLYRKLRILETGQDSSANLSQACPRVSSMKNCN